MNSKIEVTKSGAPQSAQGAASAGHPMLALRNQMDRLFDEFAGDWRFPSLSRDVFKHMPYHMPALGDVGVDVRFDVSESEEGIEVTAELPGIEEKDVEVAVDDGVLTIKGEKKLEKETKERDYYLSERRFGSFSRAMRLPDSVDLDQIKASFDKGVLSILLPKRPEAKAKKKTIEISKS